VFMSMRFLTIISWRKVMKIFSVLLLVFVLFFGCQNNNSKQKKTSKSKVVVNEVSSIEPLDYTAEEVYSDVKKATNYAQSLVKAIVSNMDANLKSQTVDNYTGDKNIEQYLIDFYTNDIPQQVKVIEKAKVLIKNAKKKYQIMMIPDIHRSFGEQPEESKKRQKKIEKKIKELNPQIAFIEGIQHSEVSKKSCWQDEQPYMKNWGESNDISMDDFYAKHYQDLTDMYWYVPFLDNPDIKLFAIEEIKTAEVIELILGLVMVLDMKFKNNQKIQEFVLYLNYGWREQLILSNCIIELEKHDFNQGVLVIGEAHAENLINLCSYWGVQFELVDLE
jgi:hypothetical protein